MVKVINKYLFLSVMLSRVYLDSDREWIMSYPIFVLIVLIPIKFEWLRDSDSGHLCT